MCVCVCVYLNIFYFFKPQNLQKDRYNTLEYILITYMQ